MSELNKNLMVLVRSGLEYKIPHKGYFELRNNWTLLNTQMHVLVVELEEELQSMKEKNLPNKLILKKDHQIQTIVDFYNYTEAVFKTYDEHIKDLSSSRKLHEENDHASTQLLIENLKYIAKHFKSVIDGTNSK